MQTQYACILYNRCIVVKHKTYATCNKSVLHFLR